MAGEGGEPGHGRTSKSNLVLGSYSADSGSHCSIFTGSSSTVFSPFLTDVKCVYGNRLNREASLGYKATV